MEKLKLLQQEKRAFYILWVSCFVAGLLLIPYVLELIPAGEKRRLSIIGIAMNGLLFYPIPIYLGFLIKRSLPVCGTPYLEGMRPVPVSSLLKFGLIIGGVVSALILLLDLGFHQLLPELKTLESTQPGPFYGFLASFYGGVVEETLLRFFLMSLLVLFLKRFGDGGVWVSIVLASVLFGVGHLPAMAQALDLGGVAELSTGVIARVLLLNSMAGIVFGWLYWKKGLEFAIVAHFFADLGLHGVGPQIL